MSDEEMTPPDRSGAFAGWSASDSLLTAAWCAAAVLARLPFVARIEGALDHDQSVVGLMALDIAAGRRFPIFFDGQRYMGAVEPYAAAAFVRAFGHTPAIVALAPLTAFGLFAAGQFAVWRCWRGRATGHLAAALTVVGSPMMVLWGIVPRGGYVEFLAWALPALYAYREVSRVGRPTPAPWVQAALGFWLAVGYFLNPLSLTVYATIALDWTLGRHGADLRRERDLRAAWLDHPFSGIVWLAWLVAWVTAMAVCCHVEPNAVSSGSPYLAFGGHCDRRWALALGVTGVVALLAAAGWWTRGPVRLYERLLRHPWAAAGVLTALAPFLVYNLSVLLGRASAVPSLPVWIRAPWKAGQNLRSALHALGPLVGCDPRAIETVLIGQPVEPPAVSWPGVETGLLGLSPVVVVVVLLLTAVAVWTGRSFWSRAFALRGEDVAPPAPLASGFLAVTTGLYLLQATSPNGSSIRYLVPVWVALPGLLACGLKALPRRAGVVAGFAVVLPWLAAEVLVWGALDREPTLRPLADALVRRGVTAVVAPTPVAVTLANLSHGSVGAVEFRPLWSRLGRRYLGRFTAGRPFTCIVDRRFPWAIRGEGAWAREEDLGRRLRELSARHPGKVQAAWNLGTFEVWDVDLPLAEILGPAPDGGPRDQ